MEEVIRDAAAAQHGVNTIDGRSETIVINSLNGEEAEHSACLEGSANILNEVIIPRDDEIASAGCDDARFGGLPEPVAADLLPSPRQAHTDDFAAPTKVASSGRVEYESRFYPEKDCWKEDPDSQWQSEGKSPSDVLLRIGCRDTHKRTNVDETIEPQNCRFGGGVGVDDDPLSGLQCFYDRLCGSHLIQIQRRHTRFEHG